MGLISRVSSRTYRDCKIAKNITEIKAEFEMNTDAQIDAEARPAYQITHIVESFEGQEDSSTAYAGLLNFLEENKDWCFSLLRLELRDDNVHALVGRINQRNVRIYNGPNKKFFHHTGQRRQLSHHRGLAEDFSAETAKAAVVEFYQEEDQSSWDHLKAWSATASLDKFLPNAQYRVTQFTPKNAAVEIVLDGRVLAEASDDSLHVAKHIAACRVLNSEEYATIFSQSGGVTYNRASHRLQEPPSESFKQVNNFLRKNGYTKAVTESFIEDESAIQMNVNFEGRGADIENAARAALNTLINLSVGGSQKKRTRQAKNRETDHKKTKHEARIENGGDNSMMTLNHMGLQAQYTYESVTDTCNGPFNCVITVGENQFSVEGYATKKLAKVAAADAALAALTQNN